MRLREDQENPDGIALLKKRQRKYNYPFLKRILRGCLSYEIQLGGLNEILCDLMCVVRYNMCNIAPLYTQGHGSFRF